MNLSKVYSVQDTFQPENIIRAKLVEEPVFNQSEAPSGRSDKGFQRQELTRESPQQKVTQGNIETPTSRSQKSRTIPDPLDKLATEPEQQQAGEQSPQKSESPGPPPPPPGISQAAVDRLVTEAYQKGITEGLQQAEQDFGSAAASLTLICQQLDTLRETVIHNSVGEIQDLVIAIAEKVIRHSVQEQSDTIVATVEEAIQKAVKSGEFYINVHPDDYAVIAAKADELIAGINGLHNVVVKKDMTVDRGGCRVESDNCTVDATITSQLLTIRDHLQEQ